MAEQLFGMTRSVKQELSKAERIAATTCGIGLVGVLVMPFLSIPFEVPYPRWTLGPMEHAIYLFLLSAAVFVVGLPASLISLAQRNSWVAWISLLTSFITWPIGVAATYFAGFLFGKDITF